jgi:hypothetical protein
MPRLRFSLASLLGIIAVIALGLTGARSASTFWTTAASTLTLALLLGAILGAWLLAGTDRAFWAGFALFGWTYLVLVNWDWVGGQLGHDLTAGLSDFADSIFAEVPVPLAPQLPGTAVPRTSAGAVGGRVPITSAAPSSLNYLDEVRQRQVRIGNFVQIGRLVLSLAFGLAGGFIGTWLIRRRDSAADVPGRPPSDPAGRGRG